MHNSSLTIDITAGTILENSTVVLTVEKLTTPTAVRAPVIARLFTRVDDSAAGLVHGPINVHMDAVKHGTVTSDIGGSANGLVWTPDITAPGVTSAATVSFRVAGALVADSSLRLELPCGWQLPSNPTVLLSQPSSARTRSTRFIEDWRRLGSQR